MHDVWFTRFQSWSFVLGMFATATMLPHSGDAQTLTPVRGLFSYAPDTKKDTHAMRNAAKDSLIVGVNVDGALRSYLNGSPTAQPNLTAGGLSFQAASYSANFTGAINIGATSDSVTTDFGRSLLQPMTLAATGKGLGWLLDYRQLFLNKPGKFPYSKLGVHGYVSGTATRWSLPIAGGNARTSIDGNVTAVGIQAEVELLNVYLASTPLAAVVDFGPIYRHLGGDLASAANAPAVTTALGTAARSFGGLEGDFTVHLSDVHIGVGIYYFGGNVTGLSNLVYGGGISAGASFLSGRITKGTQPLVNWLF